MPPRRSQVARSQPRPPTATAQTCVPAVRTEQESFNLSDISGSDNDDDIHVDNPNPTDHPHNRDAAGTSQAADAGINNLDLVPQKPAPAADIHYFFEKNEKENKTICVECR
jgi:hypothetical protein